MMNTKIHRPVTGQAIRLCLVLLFMPLVFHAQKALTGVWMGKVSNDSTTVRKDQGFELALTQYREKVYGYSRTSFIVNDTLYFILKRVKGTIDGDKCEIKDDEIVSYNFPGRIDKGVKVTTTFRLNKQDTTWHLDGNWSTNKTKKFYAITGKVELKEESDPSKSKIFAHLEELKLDKEMQFAVTAPEGSTGPVKKEQAKNTVPVNPERDPGEIKTQPGKVKKDSPAATNEPVEPVKKNPSTATNEPGNPVKKASTAPTKEPVKTSPVAAGPAADVNERTTVFQQTIEFHSDSLQLSLYDNGEVDGDTVSVLLNGELILSKQMLRTSALKTSISTPPGKDEFTLILYAENLGKYPPNTGLLIVRDGDDTYQVRFSADLRQNAAIVFRRKK